MSDLPAFDADLYRLPEPLPPQIYDKPVLRPVTGEIGAEPIENNSMGIATIRERYAVLTEPLPLGGFDALRRNTAGEFHLIAALRDAAPWADSVIDNLERQCERQLLVGEPWMRLRPLLLVGPPGCGKSWLARRIADLIGAGCGMIDLSSAVDAGAIAGNPRGWIATQPCLPAQIMADSRSANSTIIVEEVEKSGASDRFGDPVAALLALLEPATARNYRDRCLNTEIDVSAVNWIMTANAITARLSQPFLSRVDVIQLASPPSAMFDAVLDQLLADLARRWTLPGKVSITLSPSAIRVLRDDYRRHTSIRRLRLQLEAVAPLCLPERVVH